MSTQEEILTFANSNPACHLATLDGKQPRVRGMLLWFADASGFYFHTSTSKELASQIRKGNFAEAAFLESSQDPSQMRAMRVSGELDILTDADLEKRLLQERPWLTAYDDGEQQAELLVFRMKNCRAHIWTNAANMKEKEIIAV
jgi:uncharacterized pyridoxamine 5'-phosphate oxidase family protein